MLEIDYEMCTWLLDWMKETWEILTWQVEASKACNK